MALRTEPRPAVERPADSRWRRVVWWLAPALVMAVLGGLLLARRYGFWYDELYTAEVAPISLRRLLDALVRGDGTIPYLRDAPPSYNAPYYAVAHLWLALTPFGADEVGLRLLSLVAAVGAVVVVTLAVAQLAGLPGLRGRNAMNGPNAMAGLPGLRGRNAMNGPNAVAGLRGPNAVAGLPGLRGRNAMDGPNAVAARRVGMVAGLFLAANPFVVQYAAEARGYALALLASSLAALGLARWLGGPTRRGLVLYAVASAAAGLLHWFALLVPAALAVAAILLRRRRALPVVVATAVAAVPALALVVVALINGVGASGAEWLTGVGGAVPRLVLESWSMDDAPLLVATLVAAGTGMAASRQVHREARIVAACWLVVPVGLMTAMEAVRPVFVDRYLLPAMVGLAVLMALGATRPRPAVAVVACAAVLSVSVVAAVREIGAGPKDDVRSALDLVARGHRPGEPVVAAARWDAMGVDHYARERHPDLVADVVLPPDPVPAASTVWVVRRAVGGGVKGDGSKLAALDDELTGRGLRLALERRFDGRYAVVLVQRWERPAADRAA